MQSKPGSAQNYGLAHGGIKKAFNNLRTLIISEGL
jgi:hypothetical protein